MLTEAGEGPVSEGRGVMTMAVMRLAAKACNGKF